MGLSYLQFPIWKLEIERPELAECDRVQLAVDYSCHERSPGNRAMGQLRSI